MLEGFGAGIILALFLNCLVLYILTILFPSHGTCRQYIVVFIAESIMGWMDFKDDITTFILMRQVKPQTTPRQRMNGLLDDYFRQLQGA